jgi:hypothetical protein
LRPLSLSRPSTRTCRQEAVGSWPRRIGVTKSVVMRARDLFEEHRCAGLLAGARCHIAEPKPGSSGPSIFPLVGRRMLGAARGAA